MIPYLPSHPKILELSYTSLSLNHPASVQFTAWLVAFNTGDEKTLLEYHSGPDFPYSARTTSTLRWALRNYPVGSNCGRRVQIRTINRCGCLEGEKPGVLRASLYDCRYLEVELPRHKI
jgi:hypothetical protein